MTLVCHHWYQNATTGMVSEMARIAGVLAPHSPMPPLPSSSQVSTELGAAAAGAQAQD